MSDKQLWALFVPGPDDMHPAPSKEVAEHMAKLHNESMAGWLKAHPEMAWSAEFMKKNPAVAAVWTHGPEEHAELLATEFRYTDWGLPDPGMKGGA